MANSFRGLCLRFCLWAAQSKSDGTYGGAFFYSSGHRFYEGKNSMHVPTAIRTICANNYVYEELLKPHPAEMAVAQVNYG